MTQHDDGEPTVQSVFGRSANGAVMDKDSTGDGDDPAADMVKVYLAGVFDASHAIRCSIVKDAEAEVGYYIRPRITIRSRDRRLMSVVMNWLNELGIFTSLGKKGDDAPTYTLSIKKRDDVRTIIKEIRPYLITQEHNAEIVADEIMPRLDKGGRITEERFMEMVGFIEHMDTYGSRGRKYDREFFEEEFGLNEEQ